MVYFVWLNVYHQTPTTEKNCFCNPMRRFVPIPGLAIWTVKRTCNIYAHNRKNIPRITVAYNSTLFGQYNCDWTWFLRSPEQLGKVIERLLQAKLKLKAIKCNIFPKKWHFWDMLHRKMVLKLSQWKLKLSSNGNQQNMLGLWSFLGLVTYYSKFIKNFVEKAKCLHALTSTKAKWNGQMNVKIHFKLWNSNKWLLPF